MRKKTPDHGLRDGRLRKIAMCAALVLALLVPTSSAFAGNSGDTEFDTGFIQAETYYTPARSKLDATSSWIQVKGGFGKFRVTVMGANSSSSAIDVGSNSYYFYGASAGYLVNYVKERGLPLARLRFEECDDIMPSQMWGVWSPDSV